MSMKGKVALVTGASRGIGKGIAVELGRAGAKVYVSGRPSAQSDKAKGQSTLQEVAEQITASGGEGVAVYVDHADPKSVKTLFEQIAAENNAKLDILVNNAYAAVNFIMSNMTKRFWEIEAEPADAFDIINNVGLRNHYVCAVHAARLMVPRGRGLIVNIGSLGGIAHFLNVSYGIGKAGVDRLTSDAAVELRGTGVSTVSLWPGAVRTELIQSNIMDVDGVEKGVKKYFVEGETIYFPGKCVVKLATLPDLNQHSGEIFTTTQMASDYQIVDVDGKIPVDPHVVQAKEFIATLNKVRTEKVKS